MLPYFTLIAIWAFCKGGAPIQIVVFFHSAAVLCFCRSGQCGFKGIKGLHCTRFLVMDIGWSAGSLSDGSDEFKTSLATCLVLSGEMPDLRNALTRIEGVITSSHVGSNTEQKFLLLMSLFGFLWLYSLTDLYQLFFMGPNRPTSAGWNRCVPFLRSFTNKFHSFQPAEMSQGRVENRGRQWWGELA